METQNCVTIPNDDGSYTLHPGTQWIDLNQYSAAVALNIPMNKYVLGSQGDCKYECQY